MKLEQKGDVSTLFTSYSSLDTIHVLDSGMQSNLLYKEEWRHAISNCGMAINKSMKRYQRNG